MTPEERQKYAYNLKQSGRTWREIAVELGGVLPYRANKIARVHERKIKALNMATNEWERQLVERSFNPELLGRLRNTGLTSHPLHLLFARPPKLLRLKHMRKKDIIAVASMLEDYGYVKNAEDWLNNGK